MNTKDWQEKARAEGRVCPECGHPIPKAQWKEMIMYTPVRHCLGCRYAHWEVPLGCYGNVRRDNGDREDLDRIR